MTVKELIEKLKEMPQDLPVVDYGGFHVEECYIDEEYYDSDSANPNCPIFEVVRID